jgi:hypothetical protein
METERKRIANNRGRLHRVRCDWCGLAMGCSCYFDDGRGKEKDDKVHPIVMCPRCQVTEFLNLIFTGRERRRLKKSSGKDSRSTE